MAVFEQPLLEADATALIPMAGEAGVQNPLEGLPC
jgi:hypothetical protein